MLVPVESTTTEAIAGRPEVEAFVTFWALNESASFPARSWTARFVAAFEAAGATYATVTVSPP